MGDSGEGGLLITGATTSSGNLEGCLSSRFCGPADDCGADGVISNLSRPLISWLIIWSLLSSCVGRLGETSETVEGEDDVDVDALEFLLGFMLLGPVWLRMLVALGEEEA